MIVRKSASEIERMASAGQLVADTITRVGEHLEPGITTLELDKIAEDYIRSHGGVPTSMGYKGYPRAICISVNEVVVHGIPGGSRIAEGDVATIDVGVTLDGMIADDEWTISTADGSLSAHFEHTVAIGGESGPRILTLRAADREFATLLR